ncbi:alpha/beta hydrolase [Patescibacteria group bacterium]|jgi:acetyl esterase/lipase|nr:alpha/beta hydrolase [Patescibacteria group bacterium]
MQDPTEQRAELYALLGILPDEPTSITGTARDRQERPGYLIEDLLLDLNGEEAVPAYFLHPRTSPPYPVVLYSHAHGGEYEIGKQEILEGRNFLASPPYAEVLTEMGFAVLCIDHWCFGERATRTESHTFKDMLWRGKILWGMMVYDSLQALRYLRTRPDVDAEHIATLGMSMGSTMSWWVSALDEEIAACVDICCMTEFETFRRQALLDAHGIYYYVPGLLREFSTASINALIAPRPHLCLAGLQDPLTPPEGLDIVDAEMRRVYAEHGNAAGWDLIRSDSGHVETEEMRARVVDFLKTHLGKNAHV